jgi:hypothetical protein
MTRDKQKTATVETTKTVETKRVTSLEAREGQRLTSLEEAVVRMHHGVSLKPDAPLATNGVSEEVMGRLLEMEVNAFEKTGRIDELDDVPADAARNEATASIVDKLKSKG